MEEVSFALGPPEGEGKLLHKGKQGKKTKFVPVTSCSDPARLEEGVNLCDLATLRAGENYLPSPSLLRAKHKQRATGLFFFICKNLGTPKYSLFSLNWADLSCQ